MRLVSWLAPRVPVRRRPASLHLERLERRDAPAVLSDFNNDGYDDLAIGVPNADSETAIDTGAVHVLYGSVSGLGTARSQLFTTASGIAGSNHRFGAALAAGDFNNDGFGDLAVGQPGVSFSGAPAAGAVVVYFGSAAGLTTAGALLLNQTAGQGDAEANDQFGSVLVAGNFDGRPGTDLVVGVPFEDNGAAIDSGGINLFVSSNGTLVASGFYNQETFFINDTSETGDRFGFALASGNFDGDGKDDLAIGAPGESIGIVPGAGAVHTLFGEVGGFSFTKGSGFYRQGALAVADSPELLDNFGFSLACGLFDGDTLDDLAIGVPNESVAAKQGAGAVHILSAGGLSPSQYQFWSQNSYGVLDSAEIADSFGYSLAAGDFNGDGREDLAVGAYGEDIGAVNGAGAVNVLYGTAQGLSAAQNQFWNQNSSQVADQADPNDSFGKSLAVGDFNGDNRADLVIGAPLECFASATSFEGVLHVLYGSTSRLTATSSDFWTQSLLETEGGPNDQFGTVLGAGFSTPGSLMTGAVGSGRNAPRATRAQAQALLVAARERWQRVGFPATTLYTVDVRIANLGGATLGMTIGNTILIDLDAAGRGWFIDRSPRNDIEFRARGNQGEYNRIDLFTVVMHEMGHILGLGHAESGIMADLLPGGTRRVPGLGYDLRDPTLTLAALTQERKRLGL